jgi:hypothetical protein
MPIVPPASPARRRGDRRPATGAAGRQVSVAHHPRIAARVHAAKAWGALGAFALVALASSKAGAETFDVLLRALIAGGVGWVVAWAAAVGIGRSLVRAEVEAHRRALDEPAEDAG